MKDYNQYGGFTESIKDVNDRFENLLDSLVVSVSETELTPEKKKLRRAKADASDLDFCKIYYPQIFDEDFNECHRTIGSLQQGKYLITGARKIGKSAFTYIAKIIKQLALGKIRQAGLLMRTAEYGSKEKTASIVRLMKRSSMLMYDYDIKIEQDKKGHYIINNVAFLAVSIDQVLRGLTQEEFKRFDLLVADDLFGQSTVTSDNDNDKVYNFVNSEAMGQMEDDGLFIWLANIIAHNSPASMAIKEEKLKHFSFPCLVNQYGEADENGNTCWAESERHTKEYWLKTKSETPYHVWMGEYMDSPILIGEIFNPDWIRTVNINTIKIVLSISGIDPAFGKSPDSCYKSVATMSLTDKDKYILTDIYLRTEPYDLFFDYCWELRYNVPALKCYYFEDDFSQWTIAEPYYNDWVKTRGKHLPIITHSAKDLSTIYYGTSKESRIMNLIHPYQTGKILNNEAILNNNDYKIWLSQYVGFGKLKTKLDGLDAQATAFIKLPEHSIAGKGGVYESLRDRQYSNQEDAWLNNRGFTNVRR